MGGEVYRRDGALRDESICSNGRIYGDFDVAVPSTMVNFRVSSSPTTILTNLKLSGFFAAPGATCSLRFQVL